MKKRMLLPMYVFAALMLSLTTAKAVTVGASGTVSAGALALEEGPFSGVAPNAAASYSHQLNDVITLHVNAYGMPTTETASFGFDLSWDPTVLQYQSHSLDSALTIPFNTNTANSAQGVITLDGSAFINETAAEFTVATIVFTVIGSGTTTLDLQPLGNGFGFTDGQGNSIVFNNVYGATVQAVPLPGALMLFASALGGLGIFGRIRKA